MYTVQVQELGTRILTNRVYRMSYLRRLNNSDSRGAINRIGNRIIDTDPTTIWSAAALDETRASGHVRRAAATVGRGVGGSGGHRTPFVGDVFSSNRIESNRIDERTNRCARVTIRRKRMRSIVDRLGSRLGEL